MLFVCPKLRGLDKLYAVHLLCHLSLVKVNHRQPQHFGLASCLIPFTTQHKNLPSAACSLHLQGA